MNERGDYLMKPHSRMRSKGIAAGEEEFKYR